MANKILAVTVIILFILIAAGLVFTSLPKQEDYKPSEPSKVVRQYFESWDREDWPNMYSVISDGFKKIEPTAKALSDFRQYVESQSIKGVKILEMKEESNDSKTAVIQYKVEFTLSDGTKKEFSDKFTLKYREADVIKGWKLVHPYGEKIDVS